MKTDLLNEEGLLEHEPPGFAKNSAEQITGETKPILEGESNLIVIELSLVS